MPHLAVIRKGWQNEHIAAFILSRFAFVAHPAKIGDDIGTDFFCTFFGTIQQHKKDYLVPEHSFAIQIKSGGKLINVSKQIDFLSRLELPFFIGIVNQNKSLLSIYSGEYLPIFFPHKGIPESLKLELYSKPDFTYDSYCTEIQDKKYHLRCPKVTTLSATMKDSEIREETKRLKEIAKRTQKNIAAWSNDENIYSVGKDGRDTIILAGYGSEKVFRDNFKKRLAEVFHNLMWIFNHPEYNWDLNEFLFYERIYDEMRQREKLPLYLTKIADELKSKVSEK